MGRHCETIDIDGTPVTVRLAKPWASFTAAERENLLAGLRNLGGALERKGKLARLREQLPEHDRGLDDEHLAAKYGIR